MNKIGLLILLMSMSMSCAKVFNVSDAKNIAANHEVIAIIPPRVSIKAPKRSERSDREDIEKIESENFQREIYFWFLQQEMKGNIQINIQDVDFTNSLLEKEGYFDHNPLTPQEICKILGVDALVRSKFSMIQQSEGLLAVSRILTNYWATAVQVDVFLEIYDADLERLIWMFKHDLSGSIRSSPADVVSTLMYRASTKLPYLN